MGTDRRAHRFVWRIRSSGIADVVSERWRRSSSCRETERNRRRFSISRKSDSARRRGGRASRGSRLTTRNRDGRGADKVRATQRLDPAQARACANPRLITSLTLFITARRASFAPGSFSHSHRDTIAHSRGMKSTLLGSFTSLFLPFSVCPSISIQCRQSAVATDRVTRRNFARKHRNYLAPMRRW